MVQGVTGTNTGKVEEPTPEVKPQSGPLKALDWEKTGLHNKFFNHRAPKMMKPVCTEHQGTTSRFGWWDQCIADGHQPYFDQTPVPVETLLLKCECGAEVPEGELMHCEGKDLEVVGKKERLKMQVKPRSIEVMVDKAMNSGRGIERARRKGCKDPQELGFAPICEMSRCWEPNPRIQTAWGSYCTQDHAALVYKNLVGEATELLHEGKRRDQLQSVRLG